MILETSETPRPDFVECLYKYARDLAGPQSLIQEVGCGKGDSTIALAMGCRDASGGALLPPAGVITIEPGFATGTFTFPDPHQSEGYTWKYDLDAFRKRCKRCGVSGCISYLPMTSEEALRRVGNFVELQGQPLNLFFCDGAHTYEAVSIDCRWMEFVQAGGWAVFDDWIEPVERAVRDYLSAHPEQGWTILHESTKPKDGDMVVTLLQKKV
jgi:hypothetical protein